MATFRNPANGYTETTGIKTMLLGGLLGPFYYASIEAWGVVFITVFGGVPAIVLLTAALIFAITGTDPSFAARNADLMPTSMLVKILITPLVASFMWASLMVPLVVGHYRRKGWEWVD